jgi:hypothetical protein
MPFPLPTDVPHPHISAAYSCFIQRMPQEVLSSFEGFLVEISLVDKIPPRRFPPADPWGVCEFAIGASVRGVTRVKLAHPKCRDLSEGALIGVFAHEFGHVEDRLFNEEYPESDGQEEVDEDLIEQTANSHAVFWGFKEEIYQLYAELGQQIPISPRDLTDEAKEEYWEMRRMQMSLWREQPG